MKETKEKNNIIKIGIIIAIVVVLIVGLITIPNIVKNKEEKNNSTSEKLEKDKFLKEYPNVAKDHVFVYKDISEIIKILEHGTGLVYLGFPECKWCQAYVPYLNEVAKKEGLTKIYYYNILDDRKNNTKEYQKIVELLSNYLPFDDEGNKRVYAPSVIAIDRGKIVGFDDETAWDTHGLKDPKDYWTEDEVKDLKQKLSEMISKTKENICTDCNK